MTLDLTEGYMIFSSFVGNIFTCSSHSLIIRITVHREDGSEPVLSQGEPMIIGPLKLVDLSTDERIHAKLPATSWKPQAVLHR